MVVYALALINEFNIYLFYELHSGIYHIYYLTQYLSRSFYLIERTSSLLQNPYMMAIYSLASAKVMILSDIYIYTTIVFIFYHSDMSFIANINFTVMCKIIPLMDAGAGD